jgi:diguanylate cyclase (GGDEF)-like protein
MPRVLIADPDDDSLDRLEEFLSDEQEVFSARSSEQVVRACAEESPDLLLLEAELQGANGIELCRRLKEQSHWAHLPIIVMSSEATPDKETAALLAGAVDFISKPVNPAVLRARVSTHLTLKRQSDLLREQAYLDGLTALANRRRFDQQLDLEWRACQREEMALGLVLLDVDHFKQYNDYYGHQAGDRVLQTVARVLDDALRRPRDFVARFGGEEFVCLVPGADIEAVTRSAEYLLERLLSVGLPHAASPVAPYVTFSAGVSALVPKAEIPPEELIRQADHRLYHAKLAGRARVVADAPASGPASSPASGYQRIA